MDAMSVLYRSEEACTPSCPLEVTYTALPLTASPKIPAIVVAVCVP